MGVVIPYLAPSISKFGKLQLFRLEHADAPTAAMAANNKCLADSNKTRAENKATNRRLHAGQYPPVVRMRLGTVSALCRAGAVPPSGRCAHPLEP